MSRYLKIIVASVIIIIVLAIATVVVGFAYYQNVTKTALVSQLPSQSEQTTLHSTPSQPTLSQPTQSQQTPAQPVQSPQPTPTPVNSPQTPAIASPTHVYIAMQTELDAATNFDAIVVVVNKYASVNFASQINNQVAGANAFQKLAYVVVVRNLFPAIATINTNTIVEKINANTADLTVETRDSKKTGTIHLVKESGSWKIDSMNFVGQ